jgi:hypothetical protein
MFAASCGWSANIRKLAKDHKGYGSAASSLPFNVLTLTTCSIPTSLTAGVRDQDRSSQKLVKCNRHQSHICFRLIGYDTKHLEYF